MVTMTQHGSLQLERFPLCADPWISNDQILLEETLHLLDLYHCLSCCCCCFKGKNNKLKVPRTHPGQGLGGESPVLRDLSYFACIGLSRRGLTLASQGHSASLSSLASYLIKTRVINLQNKPNSGIRKQQESKAPLGCLHTQVGPPEFKGTKANDEKGLQGVNIRQFLFRYKSFTGEAKKACACAFPCLHVWVHTQRAGGEGGGKFTVTPEKKNTGSPHLLHSKVCRSVMTLPLWTQSPPPLAFTSAGASAKKQKVLSVQPAQHVT